MADRNGFPFQATGVGHLFGLHWTAQPVVDITTATTSNREMLHLANVFLYNAGYYMFQNSLGIVTSPMTPALLQGFVDTWERILGEGQAGGWLEP